MVSLESGRTGISPIAVSPLNPAGNRPDSTNAADKVSVPKGVTLRDRHFIA